MKHLIGAAAAFAVALSSTPSFAAQATAHSGPLALGEPAPVIEAVQWYNAPPLTLEDLKGRTILVEVFRTW